jgi:uncharacterized repeat protein (TIGR01451 family)
MKRNLFFSLFFVFLFSGHIQAQCVAGFNFNVFPAPSDSVVFFNSSTGSGLLTYAWDFGDSTTSNVMDPVHIYATGGTYLVCLTISDSLGCSNSLCLNVTVNIPSSVSLSFFDDSLYYFCTIPASEDFYFSSYANGYQVTDSVKFEVLFGDGTDSIFYGICTNQYISGMITHVYTNAGTYTPQMIMTGPDLSADTMNANTIVVATTCGNISGVVYHDINNNCVFDGGDIPLENVPLTIFNGTSVAGWASTDSNGVYSFNVPTGTTYNIQVNTPGWYNSHFVPTCPSTGNITVNTVPSSGIDFGLNCPAGFDLQGWVSGWGFRPGFTASVCVYVFNQFCNTPTGQIELVFDPSLTPLPDSTSTGYTINGNIVTLPITSPDLFWSFCIPVAVSSNAQIGDSVCLTMNLTPVAGDSVPTNNSHTFCFAVRNSYDPNDKYVEPKGYGAQGSIRPNTDITYTIRFQNTGNAEAVNIYILDTLDTNLDPVSVEVIASSHIMQWSLLTGNILRFNFNNILLADSNANEAASHGYITYRIKQKNNVAQMAQIRNSASIYFDFNPPIYTNKTLNTVDHFLSVTQLQNEPGLISIYPNPSDDRCQLNFKDEFFKTIIITDVVGKEVYRNSIRSETYWINTSKFAAGNYTILVVDENKAEGNSKLMVIH